jgi:hypothetical protein
MFCSKLYREYSVTFFVRLLTGFVWFEPVVSISDPPGGLSKTLHPGYLFSDA